MAPKAPSATPSSKNYTPRKAVILVGAGGTGAKCVAEVARALETVGQKFGQAIGDNGAIVHAVVVDGDERTWKETDDNPEAGVLNRSGAKKLHLFTREQDAEIRKRGLRDVMTPGLHSEHDPNGCNADPRTSRIRYLVQREGAETDANPRTLFRGIALDLINLNGGETLGETVEVVYVGGMHGGTGPVLLDVAADANAIMRDVLGRGAASRRIQSFAYLMTSESADLDPSMGRNPVQKLKRRRNCAATVARIDEATVTGQVVLADGKTVIPGVPFEYAHFINGRSGERAVADHYAPIAMVARAIVSRILERGGVASAESNVTLEILEPSVDFDRVPSNWIAMGLSELLANPSRNVLRHQKQLIALAEATGVDSSDEAEKNRRLAQVGLDQLVERTLQTVASSMPEIEEGEFGSVDKAKLNVTRLIAEFKGAIPAFRTAVQRAMQDQIKQSWAAVTTANRELREGKQIGTLVATTRTLSEQTQTLVDKLRGEQIPALQTEFAAQEGLLNQAVKDLQGLEYSKWNVFKKGEQEEAIRTAIGTIVAAADRFARTNAQLIAAQTLLVLLQKEGGVQAVVERLNAAARETEANINTVRRSLKPEGTIKSPFDLEIEVTQPDLTGAGAHLDPKDYSLDALTAMVEEVHLTEAEVDLRPYLRDPNYQAELARRAAPLVIAPSKADHAMKEPFREVTVPVNTGDTFTVASDGTIRNAEEALGIDEAYTVKATAPDGPIVMQERIYGLKALECGYLRELIREAIMAAVTNPEEMERHFSHQGQMENVLPVYADALAADECEKDGYKGQTVVMEMKGRGVEMNVYKTEAQLAQEARMAAARRPIPPRK